MRYLEGEGHFPTWVKDRLAAKETAKKKAPAGKADKKKSKVEQMKKKLNQANKVDPDITPTHFDITIFQKAMKRFCQCDG